MANMRYNFSSGSNGTVTYNSDILTNIVQIATMEVEGVASLANGKPIRLNFEKDGVYVDVTVVAEYNNSVTELAYSIQRSIKQAVESMTRYKIATIDVHVEDVVFPVEEHKEDKAE